LREKKKKEIVNRLESSGFKSWTRVGKQANNHRLQKEKTIKQELPWVIRRGGSTVNTLDGSKSCKSKVEESVGRLYSASRSLLGRWVKNKKASQVGIKNKKNRKKGFKSEKGKVRTTRNKPQKAWLQPSKPGTRTYKTQKCLKTRPGED